MPAALLGTISIKIRCQGVTDALLPSVQSPVPVTQSGIAVPSPAQQTPSGNVVPIPSPPGGGGGGGGRPAWQIIVIVFAVLIGVFLAVNVVYWTWFLVSAQVSLPSLCLCDQRATQRRCSASLGMLCHHPNNIAYRTTSHTSRAKCNWGGSSLKRK